MFQSTQRRQTGTEEEAAINMAPLIDMIFILLIFFLVTAHFTQDMAIPIQRPEAVSGTPLPVAPLRIAIATNGELMLNGRLTDMPALRQALLAYAADQPDGSIYIVPDTHSEAGRLVAVMDLAKLAGIETIGVVTRQPEGGS